MQKTWLNKALKLTVSQNVSGIATCEDCNYHNNRIIIVTTFWRLIACMDLDIVNCGGKHFTYQ